MLGGELQASKQSEKPAIISHSLAHLLSPVPHPDPRHIPSCVRCAVAAADLAQGSKRGKPKTLAPTLTSKRAVPNPTCGRKQPRCVKQRGEDIDLGHMS